MLLRSVHSLNVEHANLERNWNTETWVMKNVIRALVPKRLRPAFRRPYNYVCHNYLTKLFGHYASMILPSELTLDGLVGF